MKIFVICTVRDASKEYKHKLELYVQQLESEGHTIHLPHRDTNQNKLGINICKENREAIKQAERIDIFYSPTSQGTHFDMGMAFMAKKPIRIVENVEFGEGKSFPKMLSEWEAERMADEDEQLYMS